MPFKCNLQRYTEDKLQALAEKELAEMEAAKLQMEESLAENTRKMYDMSREYRQAKEEKDAKRDEEMKARLEAKFTEIREFQEKLEAEREVGAVHVEWNAVDA